MAKSAERDVRDRISDVFTRIEDITYIGLGVLLAAGALILLGAAAWFLFNNIFSGDIRELIVDLLDQILLILMVVEILYTVQVSFREHTLSPEPFLVVGLIAAVRRVLIITAEFSTGRSSRSCVPQRHDGIGAANGLDPIAGVFSPFPQTAEPGPGRARLIPTHCESHFFLM